MNGMDIMVDTNLVVWFFNCFEMGNMPCIRCEIIFLE